MRVQSPTNTTLTHFRSIYLAFSFEYKISHPKVCCLWGKAEDGGKNFSGLVGDLFNGYTDIAWAQLFFTLERSQFIDYTDAYMFDYGGFMVRIFDIETT